MLFNPLSMLLLEAAKQVEAERAAEQHRLLQLCMQQSAQPSRYGRIMASLGRLLVLIGTKLETRHQTLGFEQSS